MKLNLHSTNIFAKNKLLLNYKKLPMKFTVPLILLIILAGGFFFYQKQKPEVKKAPEEIAEKKSEAVAEQKKYSLDEIAKHSVKEDCWFAIEDKVYDVTSYISSGFHPGKAAILEGCGKDATVLFNTRPMGSKTPHSDKARSYLGKFQIGVLSN